MAAKLSRGRRSIADILLPNFFHQASSIHVHYHRINGTRPRSKKLMAIHETRDFPEQAQPQSRAQSFLATIMLEKRPGDV
jgi:hypothetical protein